MTLPEVVSREQWLAARKELLAAEKELTRQRDALKGWTFPWYSSYGSDFNYDFHVTLDESVAPVEYNYRSPAEHVAAGTAYYVEGDQPIERPGLSCFLRDGDRVFHTYSTYGRGTESLAGSYYHLDVTALGRQEDWEEPKGRSDRARVGNPSFAE